MPDTSRTDLSRFLNPRGIAVVGVSNDAARIGGQTLSLLTDFGYTGKIYPVNPRYNEVKGLTCYPDLTAVPKPCDVALIALSAANVAGAIEQCGKAEFLSPWCSRAASARSARRERSSGAVDRNGTQGESAHGGPELSRHHQSQEQCAHRIRRDGATEDAQAGTDGDGHTERRIRFRRGRNRGTFQGWL
jgi:predicted CoA-binding protein